MSVDDACDAQLDSASGCKYKQGNTVQDFAQYVHKRADLKVCLLALACLA